MVDNLTVKTYDVALINRIIENLKSQNNRFVKMQIPNRYHLYNDYRGGNKAYLTINIINGYSKECKISGSMRKWYFGALSDDDLSRKNIIDAFELLAQRLFISIEELCTFIINKIEIGLNCKTQYDSSYVKTLICSYRSSAYKLLDGEGYRSFATITKNQSLKIYDKKNEISKKFRLIKDTEEDNFIKYAKDKNILRIEFAVQGGYNKVKKLTKIDAIGDIINHYPRLSAYFLKYLRLMQFKKDRPLEFSPKKGTQKELTDFLIAYALINIGDVEIQNLISQLKPDVRSDARKSIKQKKVNPTFSNEVGKEVIIAAKNRCLELLRN